MKTHTHMQVQTLTTRANDEDNCRTSLSILFQLKIINDGLEDIGNDRPNLAGPAQTRFTKSFFVTSGSSRHLVRYSQTHLRFAH